MRWGAPIEELQERTSWREFRYWCEVYRQRPFDDEYTLFMSTALLRADMRALAGGKKQKIDIDQLIPYRKRDAATDLERRIDEVL